MPQSSFQTTPPIVRVCHANAKWTVPLKISSQATSRATAIPAAGGTTIARTPATIIRTLSPIDPPRDSFTIVPIDVALIFPPSEGLGRPKFVSRPGVAALADSLHIECMRPSYHADPSEVSHKA